VGPDGMAADGEPATVCVPCRSTASVASLVSALRRFLYEQDIPSVPLEVDDPLLDLVVVAEVVPAAVLNIAIATLVFVGLSRVVPIPRFVFGATCDLGEGVA
jgi:hypothetical protein